MLLDADVDRLQLLLAAYTTFTDVDIQCLERLRAKLDLATVLTAGQMPREAVRLGSHVWIQDMMTCDTHEYVLAFDKETHSPHRGLSILTPLGIAVLGAREGEEITCAMADGISRLRIVKVFRVSEAEGPDTAIHAASRPQILCATDLLPKTEHAIARAGMIADELNADLTLMHAFRTASNDDLRQRWHAEQALAQLRSRVTPRGNCASEPQVLARRGAAAAAIAATARELDADLVVLGPHERRVVRDSLVGSTIDRMLRTNVSPVLIVRHKPERAYRTVVFGVDLSPVSLRALRTAEQLTGKDASVRLIVHAYRHPYINSSPEFQKGWSRRAENLLRKHLSRAGIDQTRYELILEEHRPVTALLEVAKRRDADLVVVGMRGRRIWGSSLASRLADAAGCDLLVGPEERPRKPTWIEVVAHDGVRTPAMISSRRRAHQAASNREATE